MKLTHGDGVALVAGGSGGLGRSIVECLADAGLSVALTYNQGEDRATALAQSLGPRTRAYNWGGSSAEEASALVTNVREQLGAIGFLVVASGISQHSAFHSLEDERWRNILDTNLAASIALAKAVITPMLKSGCGRILFLSSVAASRGIEGLSVYAAAKAGLEGLTRSLAREAASFGVTVNCVAPGVIETPMLDEMPQRQRDKWVERTPMGRLGQPADVASLVGFLLSEQAAYVTGQTWVVDGGLSL